MKKLFCLLLCLILLSPSFLFAESYAPLEAHFVYSCETQNFEELSGFKQTRAYPNTINPDINAILRQKIDGMAENAKSYLPVVKNKKRRVFDTGAYMRRTGESLMSFYILSTAISDGETYYTNFDSINIDIKDGIILGLLDIVSSYEALKAPVLKQFLAYYKGYENRREENIKNIVNNSFYKIKFTMDTARLVFHIDASELIEGTKGVLHAYIYYKDIQNLLTSYGKRQTDNSKYRAVCLSYDDGPTGMSAIRIMRSLRNYGGSGVFFYVGKVIKGREDVVKISFDANFTVGYHSYNHQIENMKPEIVEKELERNNIQIVEITGIKQTIMRPPGGREKVYIKSKIPMAVLNWTRSIGSMGYDKNNYKQIAAYVGKSFIDGGVILIHDTREKEVEMSEIIAHKLYETGALIVTPEELFALKGIEMRNSTLYADAADERLEAIKQEHERQDKLLLATEEKTEEQKGEEYIVR